jgi:Protein of unknown function (DUF2510)
VSLGPSDVPMGWYPDPSGERQWRWWAGSAWAASTIPYGEPIVPVSLASDIALIQALHRLVRYGIAMFFIGLAILVSVQAHWPGSAKPVSETFAVTLSNAGVALALLGSAGFAFAARELEGRWVWWAFVPVLNLFAVLTVVTRRLGGRPVQRVGADVFLFGLFVLQFHNQMWLCIAPVILAVGESAWVTALIEKLLSAPSATSAPAL